MKKVVTAGLLAISWIALAQQQSFAWVNCKFGMGLNWDYSSGGNSYVWGGVRNGQPPAPCAFAAPFVPAMPDYTVPQFHAAAPTGPAPAPAIAETRPGTGNPTNFGSPYQFATYPRPVYNNPTTWYGR